MRGKYIIITILLLISLQLALALPVEEVRLTGYVNDYTQTLSQSEISQLNNQAKLLYDTNTAQVAIVIVDDFNGLTREEYAIQIGHENLGTTTDDNGLLILVGKDVREYRIEVGYGLEGVLNDAKVGKFGRDYLVPAFQQEQYGLGLSNLMTAITNEFDIDNNQIITQPQQPIEQDNTSFILWLTFFIAFIIIRMASYTKNKTYAKDHDRSTEDAIAAGLLASMFFRGRGGGGLGGGGFGGFGGGGFGGGGAGGGW